MAGDAGARAEESGEHGEAAGDHLIEAEAGTAETNEREALAGRRQRPLYCGRATRTPVTNESDVVGTRG